MQRCWGSIRQAATGPGQTRPRRCLTGRTSWVSAISRSIPSLRKISPANQDEVGTSLPCSRKNSPGSLQDERVKKYRIRIQMVGDRSLLPDDLRDAVDAAEASTRENDGFCLNIALAYGGRNEIVLAAREILAEVASRRAGPGYHRCPDGGAAPSRGKRDTPGRPDHPDRQRLPDLQLPALACKRARIGSLFLRPLLAAVPEDRSAACHPHLRPAGFGKKWVMNLFCQTKPFTLLGVPIITLGDGGQARSSLPPRSSLHTRATNNDDSLDVDLRIEIKPDFFGKRYARFTRLNKNL